MPKKIDNLFLNIGAMKAGTTWLYSMMNTHPDVFFAHRKEIHYFASGLYPEQLERRSRFKHFKRFMGFMKADTFPPNVEEMVRWFSDYLAEPVDDDWYVQLFDANPGKKYCADFSNLYANLGKREWQHVESMTDNLKVVFIMRHPVKRLWSHYKFHLARNREPLDAEHLNPVDINRNVRSKALWTSTAYSGVVKSIKKNLDPDQYMIAFFEDIHENPEAWLAKLEEFLQIRPHQYDAQLLTDKVNPSKTIKMPDFFPKLFAADLKKEMKKLEAQGLTLPDSWMDIREY
jgi:sulfotransferase family protein